MPQSKPIELPGWIFAHYREAAADLSWIRRLAVHKRGLGEGHDNVQSRMSQAILWDPGAGGNSTAYAYPQDPVNVSDLNGRESKPYKIARQIHAAAVCGSFGLRKCGEITRISSTVKSLFPDGDAKGAWVRHLIWQIALVTSFGKKMAVAMGEAHEWASRRIRTPLFVRTLGAEPSITPLSSHTFDLHKKSLITIYDSLTNGTYYDQLTKLADKAWDDGLARNEDAPMTNRLGSATVLGFAVVCLGPALAGCSLVPGSGEDYSCSRDGYAATRQLQRVAMWEQQYASPVVSNDCSDSGSAGVEVELNGTVRDALRHLPPGFACKVDNKTHFRRADYPTQAACTLGKIRFFLGLDQQSVMRTQTDGFPVAGYMKVTKPDS